MHISNIEIESTDKTQLIEWILSIFEPEYSLILDNSEVFFSENYSLLNSNGYLSVLTVKLNSNSIAISMVVGGTSGSILNFDYGTSKRIVKSVINHVIEYCNNNDIPYEQLDNLKL